MRQGVVHVLHIHHVILLIPNAVLPGKQVREELGESQTQRGDHHTEDGWCRVLLGLCQHGEMVHEYSTDGLQTSVTQVFSAENSDCNRLYQHMFH